MRPSQSWWASQSARRAQRATPIDRSEEMGWKRRAMLGIGLVLLLGGLGLATIPFRVVCADVRGDRELPLALRSSCPYGMAQDRAADDAVLTRVRQPAGLPA